MGVPAAEVGAAWVDLTVRIWNVPIGMSPAVPYGSEEKGGD